MSGLHVPYAAWQLLYIAICLAGIGAIFHLQRYRYRWARGCRYWLYTVVAFGLGWEAIDAWKYGVPGWPGSRWILVPSLVAVMAWSAIADWRERRGRPTFASSEKS